MNISRVGLERESWLSHPLTKKTCVVEPFNLSLSTCSCHADVHAAADSLRSNGLLVRDRSAMHRQQQHLHLRHQLHWRCVFRLSLRDESVAPSPGVHGATDLRSRRPLQRDGRIRPAAFDSLQRYKLYWVSRGAPRHGIVCFLGQHKERRPHGGWQTAHGALPRRWRWLEPNSSDERDVPRLRDGRVGSLLARSLWLNPGMWNLPRLTR